MNHLKQIAAKLPEFQIDAMLVTSAPGEFYATGLHGEGYAVVTSEGTRYITDSRYTEVAQETVGPYAEVCIVGEKGYFTFINEFLAEHNVQKLGIENGYMSLSQYDPLKTS